MDFNWIAWVRSYHEQGSKSDYWYSLGYYAGLLNKVVFPPLDSVEHDKAFRQRVEDGESDAGFP